MIPCSKAGRDAIAESGTDGDRKIIAYLDLLQEDPAPPRYPGVPGMSGMLRGPTKASPSASSRRSRPPTSSSARSAPG